MNEEKLKKIRQFIKNKANREDWKFHILPVVNYSKELAKIYKTDEEIVELAALLHDIGRIGLKNAKNHHITGALKAEKILKTYNYPNETIERIKHCVESHRNKNNFKPRSLVAKIVANADVMAHFDNFLILVFLGVQRKFKFEDIIEWLDEKIERDWNKKLTLPQAKKMMGEKYKAIKLLLNSVKKHI